MAFRWNWEACGLGRRLFRYIWQLKSRTRLRDGAGKINKPRIQSSLDKPNYGIHRNSSSPSPRPFVQYFSTTRLVDTLDAPIFLSINIYLEIWPWNCIIFIWPRAGIVKLLSHRFPFNKLFECAGNFRQPMEIGFLLSCPCTVWL